MRINFSIWGRKYDIKWNRYNVAQVEGKTAVGKTLFCKDLQDYQKINPKYRNVLIINASNAKSEVRHLFEEETYKEYKAVIIDNADLIITPELESIISEHFNTYWLLMGRRFFSCVLSLSSIGYFVKENGVFQIDYSKKVIAENVVRL